MLELKNVSKFYYKKGMITTGFSKINLKFDMGEFIAITGESGSGKSTLLNVISGLDSYEEGEMYINGEETSYYSEKDYKKKKKKYIGNIFQNFNLVNSYTVYQNIELIYLLNGFKAHEVKKKINELIKQVDLTKYKNRKVSKLSGGQKQRVAIARALAQNTPIILADEPTGNLDKKSSENVLKILHEISKNKLVIVVTHNYDQIEEYVTRKITMSDGKIIEDKRIKKHDEVAKVEETTYFDMRPLSKLKLGIRNAFNILSKFLIITFVYLYVVLSLFITYTGFVTTTNLSQELGYNDFFDYSDLNRIVINKKDRTIITEEDYEKLKSLSNISKVVEKDILLDQTAVLYFEDFYVAGRAKPISEVKKVDFGRLPETNEEVVVRINPDYNYQLSKSQAEETIKDKFSLAGISYFNGNTTRDEKKVSIVGIVYDNEEYDTYIYLNDELLNEISDAYIKSNTDITYGFLGSERTSSYNAIYEELIPDTKVKKGTAVVSEDYSYLCKNYNCKNYKLYIKAKTVYSEIDKNIKVAKMYNKKTFKKLTSYKYDDYNGAIFVNPEDYESLFDKNNYQSSVFIEDDLKVNETLQELDNLGYKTIYIKDSIAGDEDVNILTRIMNIARLIVNIANVFILFFVSYFVIKLVIKSRNIYFSTLRILGSSFKDTKKLLNIELFTYANIAYVIFLTIITLAKKKIIDMEVFNVVLKYSELHHYIIVYIILCVICLLTTSRYSRKLFVGSVMNSYREEV